MSSVTRFVKEPTNLRRQFAVHGYLGYSENTYYFTVENNKLYRIEADFENVHWIVARDMGAQKQVNEIDSEIINAWENANGWSNIRVIRPGIARKFQALSMVRGDRSISYNNGPAWNAEAYLNDTNTDVYNYETNTVNDMLVIGRDVETNPNNYEQTLPFATFWAMNDPIVIEYVFSNVTYRRAIKNRIDETTLF